MVNSSLICASKSASEMSSKRIDPLSWHHSLDRILVYGYAGPP
jgi:hypothetical protein